MLPVPCHSPDVEVVSLMLVGTEQKNPSLALEDVPEEEEEVEK